MTEREEQAVVVLNTLHDNPLLSDIHRQALEVGIMAIKALSSSENPNKWIPVSERLPEEKGTYLVTQKATFTDYVYISVAGYALNLHDVDEYDFEGKKRAGWYEYDSEYGYYEIDNVVAWMSLPEPYKAESEVQE